MEDSISEVLTLDEDPVSFLAGIREECPDILSILTTEQVKLLSQCPTDPYSEGKVDQEYLLEAWNHQCIRMMWRENKLHIANYLLNPKADTNLLSTQDQKRKNSNLEKVDYLS